LVIDHLKFNVEGIYGSCSCTLPLVVEVVRAKRLGKRAGISHSDVVGDQRLTSIMVVSLPAPYVEF